jgi:8-oxo-dGTP pyrophosphatase MutT (NUDIX family)
MSRFMALPEPSPQDSHSCWTTAQQRFREQVIRALTLPPLARTRLKGYVPELAYGRHAGPAPTHAKRGAVLIVLYPVANEWQLVLTVRQQHLLHHAGQISLPGGKCDPAETVEETAVREYREEVGSLVNIEILGTLPDVYVFASNFKITPCVALVPALGEIRPNAAEVADVLKVSLHTLLDPQRRSSYAVIRGPLRFTAPCCQLGSRALWGATWIILGEFLERLLSLGPLPR